MNQQSKTQGITIRGFRGSDFDSLIALLESVFPHGEADEDQSAAVRDKISRNQKILVAVRGDKIVGCMFYGFDGIRAWIYGVAVSRDHRSKGIGQDLMIEGERLLKNQGCQYVKLQVRNSNTLLIGFYKRLDYVVSEHIILEKIL